MTAVTMGNSARGLVTSLSRALQVCIVGSGPAGCYTAQQLFRKYGDDVEVTLLDRLPTPFGLVRSGVAPDHQDTKNVTNQFTRVCQDPRLSFFGNVTLGRDVSLRELRQRFHAVVLAYGCESDKRLRIKGEDSRGMLAAREFVWWYNGHPDAAHLPVDLRHVDSVAVCGIGNVALDCARVLLRPLQQLTPTDIADHAVAALAASRVRRVHLFARRGPVQAACTPKELKELATLDASIAVHAAADQMVVSDDDRRQMASVRLKRRIHEIISKAAAHPPVVATRHLHFQFYRQPVEVMADASGAVEALRVEKTALQVQPGRGTVAVGTGEFETHPVQLVLKSIGYASLPVEGLPFDPRAGVVPNVAGFVLQEPGGSEFEEGLFVVGWLKRGPTGIIGTNLTDADETVDTLDAARGRLPVPTASTSGADGLRGLLSERGVRFVDWGAWQRLDAAELARGAAAGKVRDKVVEVEDMLRLAAA